MSEETSLISMHPFFHKFVFAVVETIRRREGMSEIRTVVNADLVPRFNERVSRVAISREAPEVDVRSQRSEFRGVGERDLNELVAPISVVRPEIRKRVVVPERVEAPKPEMAPPSPISVALPPRPEVVNVPEMVVPKPVVVSAPVESDESEVAIDVGGSYGSIEPLLNDPSVSTIECLGKGKELMIVRAGQKMKTKIVLGEGEIKEVLEKVADETHIPLMEGIFRAGVKGFSINAVVSEMVGSRFVIKKANAYGLLE